MSELSLIWIVMICGLWVIILSFFIDIDFMKIKEVNFFFSNLKENTKYSIGIVLLIMALGVITKIYIIIPASIIFGLIFPGILAKYKDGKINDLKITQWTAVVDDLSSGIRAGLTISEALSQALSNSEEPLRQEFLEAIVEFDRSGQVSKVMAILQEQVKDVVGISTLKLLQVVLKTGANDLATSLSILSSSSRETSNLIQELKTKQAWVLNGARVSVVAPWLILLALWTQESVRSAYQNLMGQFILFMVALVGVIGYLMMKKIGKIVIFGSGE